MKLGTLICALCLSASMAIGVGVAVSVGNSANAAEADSSSLPAGVYVDISACQWNTWGASLSDIKAYFIHNGAAVGDAWPGTNVTSTSVNGTTYGYISVPYGASGVIFNAWGGGSNQNQTEDLTIPTDGKCLFKVESYNTSSKQTGNWYNLEQRYGTTSASTSTGRVFLNNDNAHSDWKSATLAVRAWGGSASQANNASHSYVTASTYLVSWFGGEGTDSKWYAFADVPTNITGYQFVRMSGDTTSATVWSYSDAFELSDSSFSCVYYLNATSTDNCPVSTGRADSVGPALATRVIESRNTCNSNAYNGYGAYTSLNNNFFKQCTASASSTSCKSLGGSTNYTVAQHVAFMQKQSGASASSIFILEKDSGVNVVVLLVAAAIISVSSIAGFMFIRKRRLTK